jgi:hypothetical protein
MHRHETTVDAHERARSPPSLISRRLRAVGTGRPAESAWRSIVINHFFVLRRAAKKWLRPRLRLAPADRGLPLHRGPAPEASYGPRHRARLLPRLELGSLDPYAVSDTIWAALERVVAPDARKLAAQGYRSPARPSKPHGAADIAYEAIPPAPEHADVGGRSGPATELERVVAQLFTGGGRA